MTDLNNRIKELLGYSSERPGSDAETQYHVAFNQSGVNKAKEVLAELDTYGARLERLAYLSIGGSTGAEILHVLEQSAVRFGVLLEFDDVAGGIAEERGKTLTGKTLRVFRGDATQKITACRQLLERWYVDGKIDGIVCSIQAVLHELPTRSPGYDVNHLLGEALWKWDPCYLFCREPCSPRQWPERVKLSVAGVDGTLLRALASHVGSMLGIPGEARSSGPDAILVSRDLAVELLFKLFYIRDYAYEIGERVTSVSPERLLAAAAAALKGGIVTPRWQNSDSFERLYREYGVEAADPETNDKLPLPIAYVRLVGRRDSLSSKGAGKTDAALERDDAAGARREHSGDLNLESRSQFRVEADVRESLRPEPPAPLPRAVRAGWKWLWGTSVAFVALLGAVLLNANPENPPTPPAPRPPADSTRNEPVPPNPSPEPKPSPAPAAPLDSSTNPNGSAGRLDNAPVGTAGSIAAARHRYAEKEYAEALPIFTAAAEAGNPEAMGFLGIMYLNGFGTDKDHDMALKWLRRGATKRDARSMNALGIVYKDGLSVDRNYMVAKEWFLLAERNGYAEAMNNIGDMYRQGLGVQSRPDSALHWYEKGANAGSLNAMVNAGLMYKLGLTGSPDLNKAIHWLRTAADARSSRGMSELGSMYQEGIGVRRDYEAARTLYLRAANTGSAQGMYNLGALHYNGLGVRKNQAEAIHWFRKAAAAGSVEAMGALNALGVAAP
ncbi:MAG TPA: tetratricopeptide repeat protein [Longimicrobium sp.]